MVRGGRWGIRQVDGDGKPTGGGTVGLGYATREAAQSVVLARREWTITPLYDEVYDRYAPRRT